MLVIKFMSYLHSNFLFLGLAQNAPYFSYLFTSITLFAIALPVSSVAASTAAH